MIAKVKSQWVDGDLVFYDLSGNEIARFDESAHTLTVEGDAVAHGTQAAVIADIGDSATGAQIAAAVNALIDAVQAFGIVATV
ncbi:MAG: hypothetical protein VB078_00420 [Clostridiaceae bacterium]|nr:hypothetical protein [Clostridiaceae bacterium]